METHCDYKFTCDGRLGVHLCGGGKSGGMISFLFRKGKLQHVYRHREGLRWKRNVRHQKQRGWLMAQDSLRMERTGEERGEKVVLSRK